MFLSAGRQFESRSTLLCSSTGRCPSRYLDQQRSAECGIIVRHERSPSHIDGVGSRWCSIVACPFHRIFDTVVVNALWLLAVPCKAAKAKAGRFVYVSVSHLVPEAFGGAAFKG